MEYEEEIEKKMGHSSYAGRKDVFRLIRHIELASSNCVTGDGGDVLVSTLVFMHDATFSGSVILVWCTS